MSAATTFLLAAALCVASPQAEVRWDTYHGGAGLSGYAPADLKDDLRVVWRHRLPGPVRVTPVGSNRAVYVVAGRQVLAVTTDRQIMWEADLGQDVEAPPVMAGEALVVGTSAGTLFALDLVRGSVIWRYETGSRILGGPNVVLGDNGRSVVVISQSDGVLHRVRLSDGQRLWRTSRASRCDGAVAVDGGLVVYGNCDAALYFHDAVTGRPTGKVQLMTDGQVYAGIALADGSVYAGDRSGRLYAVDVELRTIQWTSTAAEADLSSTPAVSRNLVVFGSDNGSFYAVDRKSGALVWTVNTGGRPLSPVIGGERVLAAADGTLYLLELDTGKVLDQMELSDQITSPALLGDSIFIGTEEGFLFHLTTRGRREQAGEKEEGLK